MRLDALVQTGVKAGAGESAGKPDQRPPIAAYDRASQAKFADRIERLPLGAAQERAMLNYARLREQPRGLCAFKIRPRSSSRFGHKTRVRLLRAGNATAIDQRQQFSFCLLGRFGMRQFDSALSGFLGPATVIQAGAGRTIRRLG
jgi:hypothetical protein